MSRDWEQIFRNWGSPPSQTEQDKCDNAERAIRKAISASARLKDSDITVFPKGSYRNRTNARLSSDVDICVLCRNTINVDYPEGMTDDDTGLHPATYHYSDYKNDIENALVGYFGRNAVTRGNKAFDVHENTYRVDSDVVACFVHRRYRPNGTYLTGECLHPDNGGTIINWSNQNYDNGVEKNQATGRRFKAVVRILKRLRNEMADNNYGIAENLPSFLIECLVYNVPNEGFGHDSYIADVRWVLAYLCNNTRKDSDCEEWVEVNELKYLFRLSKPWTREQANAFLNTAWSYIGFK